MFTVHIQPEGRRVLAVYAIREWSQGIDTTRHKLARFNSPKKAECYGLALSDALGGCAVVYH